MCLCLYVCLQDISKTRFPYLTKFSVSVHVACGPLLQNFSGIVVTRYVLFGFVDEVMFARNVQAWAMQKGCMLKVIHQGAALAEV